MSIGRFAFCSCGVEVLCPDIGDLVCVCVWGGGGGWGLGG